MAKRWLSIRGRNFGLRVLRRQNCRWAVKNSKPGRSRRRQRRPCINFSTERGFGFTIPGTASTRGDACWPMPTSAIYETGKKCLNAGPPGCKPSRTTAPTPTGFTGLKRLKKRRPGYLEARILSHTHAVGFRGTDRGLSDRGGNTCGRGSRSRARLCKLRNRLANPFHNCHRTSGFETVS